MSITKTISLLLSLLLLSTEAFGQAFNERLLSETENAYNPIPSPDGSLIAFVRTGRWDKGSGGYGRSNLRSQVMVMSRDGRLLTQEPLADSFLAGWTADGMNLICYRDWRYSLVSREGKTLRQGAIPNTGQPHTRTERVSFISSLETFVWVQKERAQAVMQTDKQGLAAHDQQLGDMIIPSPDERYIAVTARDHFLSVYDRHNKTWANLGRVTIHPDDNWDHSNPSWNPWFADSARLAFISDSALVVSSPDGKSRQVIARLTGSAGLPVPSPDGRLIAYATFKERARESRPDLKFFGNSRLWVISATREGKAYPVTRVNEDTTYCVRWLGNKELVFDRIGEEPFLISSRLWKASVPR